MGRKRKISNQKNTSVAKIVRQGEYNVLNPLFMTEILPKIFNYLDILNLKRSRLVCKLWGFEGGKILLNKSNIKIDCFAQVVQETISTDVEQFENFLNTKGISATCNSVIKYMDSPNMLKKMPLIPERTSALLLHSCYSHSQGETIVEFLQFFPNLQILDLRSYWNDNDNFSLETEQALLTKFESIKEIRLKTNEQPPYNFTTLLLNKIILPIKEIHLQANAYMFFEKYLQTKCNWPIDTLVLQINSLCALDLKEVGTFLVKISGSLKHLEWKLTGSQTLSAKHLVPWANNFINPSTFNGLETLKIWCCFGWKSPFCDFSFWLLFTFALQLPNLKKLAITEVPENLEMRLREWNNHPAAAGRTLRSESLEEFSFLWSMSKVEAGSFVVFSRRLWPNLKSLCIENPPDNLPSSFLLSEWIGLERLDLKFEKLSEENVSLWTKWLTGLANPDDDNVAFQDLKDLKHFGLWQDWTFQSTRIASDFLVDNSLKFMTQLQSLHLTNSSNISQKVKKTLKEALGPNVNIEFKN